MSHPSSRAFYGAEQVRELDRRAIEDCGIPGHVLMKRAAAAAWSAAVARLRKPKQVVVVAGSGNNGGDGYELARLAQSDGIEVRVLELAGERRGDAATARSAWLEGGDAVFPASADALSECGKGVLLVDAVFGTGLSRAPRGEAAACITAINAARDRGAQVLALDIPSGLFADSGQAPGVAVSADLTVSFIGRKPGLHLGEGPDRTGDLVFDALEIPATIYEALPQAASLLGEDLLRSTLSRRPRSAHKGSHGHVLLIGGDGGTNGALLMAARAALRSGAGLVSVATRAAHAAALAMAQAELMPHGVEDVEALASLIDKADVVAIGPGLGQRDWGRTMFKAALDCGRLLVLDADALNLLADSPRSREDWVLTPHPGEAARLLQLDTATIQADRLSAVAQLQQRYGGVAVLKGAGSLVQGRELGLCPHGNPGMGVGGMGDVLTGVVAAVLAQHRSMPMSTETAVGVAVAAHALAGDLAAKRGERGLLPSDLIDSLREIMNP
ncbi:MAG: NAD(P)H-hydrate dehydratase [Pseudomonadota bacterium]|nr:NAD(P)H-hydrate dehydratase [Pseudomonadota bacterium]